MSVTTTTTAHDHDIDPKDRRRAIGASFVGTMIEYYDFTLYGLAAVLVFGPLYFPELGGTSGTLATFATFAIGFVVRPFGGFLFGHIGDRYGRKPVLMITLLMMGGSTIAIGLLPTAASIGHWAPVLLVVLRMVQGFGAGAEYAGAVVLVSEYAKPGRRGLTAGLPGVGVYVGIVIATAVFTATTFLPEATFLSWGWRVPFLMGFVGLMVGLYLRLKVEESPEFKKVAEAAHAAKAQKLAAQPPAPLKAVFQESPRQLLSGVFMGAGIIPWSYAVQVFVIGYATGTVGVSRTVTLTGLLIAAAVTAALIPVFGSLSDRHGRKKVIGSGLVFAALWAFPMFALVNTGNPVLITIAIVGGLSVVQASTFGPSAAFLTESFPARTRFSGVAVSREVPNAALAGTAPLVSAALLSAGGDRPWLVAGYLLLLASIAFVATLAMPPRSEG